MDMAESKKLMVLISKDNGIKTNASNGKMKIVLIKELSLLIDFLDQNFKGLTEKMTSVQKNDFANFLI